MEKGSEISDVEKGSEISDVDKVLKFQMCGACHRLLYTTDQLSDRASLRSPAEDCQRLSGGGVEESDEG